MLHVLHRPATDQQLNEMLEVYGSYLKVAVDIQRHVLAGGRRVSRGLRIGAC